MHGLMIALTAAVAAQDGESAKRIEIFHLQSKITQLENVGNAHLAELAHDLASFEDLAVSISDRLARPVSVHQI